jgi:hypothetical protein
LPTGGRFNHDAVRRLRRAWAIAAISGHPLDTQDLAYSTGWVGNAAGLTWDWGLAKLPHAAARVHQRPQMFLQGLSEL